MEQIEMLKNLLVTAVLGTTLNACGPLSNSEEVDTAGTPTVATAKDELVTPLGRFRLSNPNGYCIYKPTSLSDSPVHPCTGSSSEVIEIYQAGSTYELCLPGTLVSGQATCLTTANQYSFRFTPQTKVVGRFIDQVLFSGNSHVLGHATTYGVTMELLQNFPSSPYPPDLVLYNAYTGSNKPLSNQGALWTIK